MKKIKLENVSVKIGIMSLFLLIMYAITCLKKRCLMKIAIKLEIYIIIEYADK